MPLFRCHSCGAIDNTAVAAYWPNVAKGKPPLCSECATGHWHGIFPKRDAIAGGFVQRPDGFWEWQGQQEPPKCKLCGGSGRRRCVDLMCSCMTDFHRCECATRRSNA